MSADPRTWPHNLEAERSVLGAILLDNEALDEAATVVSGPSFYRAGHRVLFDRMAAMRDRKVAIDFTTLLEHLRRENELEDAGGASYVHGLIDGIPGLTNVTHYAEIIREKALLRSLIKAAQQITDDALGGGEADEILNKAESAVMAVAQSSIRGDFQPVDELVRKASQRFMEAHEHPRVVTGVSSGIADLDRFTRGFQPGEIIYLAAGTSRGKSALMMQMAVTAAMQGPVGIVSLEMSADSLIDRAIAQLAGVDAFRMKTGHLRDYEQQRCGKAFEQLASTRLYVDDVVGLPAAQLRAKVRRFAARKQLCALFIDYAQLMHESGKWSSRNEELTAISRGWKLLAIELKVPIIILSQLSRSGTKGDDDKPPSLADLRDSGALEQDADVVLLIWRHTEGGEKVVDLIVAKQRNGPTGPIRVQWLPEQMRFVSPGAVQDAGQPEQPEMAL